MKYVKKVSSKILVVMIVLSMTISTFAATVDTKTLLVKGSSGTQVTYLQYNLNGLGYYTDSIDGVFGANTETAVKKYQKAKGLADDGKAGPNTLSTLVSEVKSIQSKLKTLGFYSGDTDGIYGSGTKTAVKSFQTKYSLSATGIANSTTISKINNTSVVKDVTYKVSITSLYQTGDTSVIKYPGGSTTVATSGCGGVSLAMAVNALKQTSYTGKQVMQWMADNGYYAGNGTVQAGLVKYATNKGLIAKYADTSSTLISNLKKGAVAIAIVKDKTGHGYFANSTSSGHYILISGYRINNGVEQIYVNNPIKTKISGWFDLSKLEKNVKNENEGYSNSYVIISK